MNRGTEATRCAECTGGCAATGCGNRPYGPPHAVVEYRPQARRTPERQNDGDQRRHDRSTVSTRGVVDGRAPGSLSSVIGDPDSVVRIRYSLECRAEYG